MPEQDNINPKAVQPSTLIRPDRCEMCKFASPLRNDERYECHRNPPAVTAFLGPGPDGGVQVLNSTAFPLVQPSQWCSEFKMKISLQ